MRQLLVSALQACVDGFERRPKGRFGTGAQGGLQIFLSTVDLEHDLPPLPGEFTAEGAQLLDLAFGESLLEFLPDAANFVAGRGSPPSLSGRSRRSASRGTRVRLATV
jgi:hypothetical protein